VAAAPSPSSTMLHGATCASTSETRCVLWGGGAVLKLLNPTEGQRLGRWVHSQPALNQEQGAHISGAGDSAVCVGLRAGGRPPRPTPVRDMPSLTGALPLALLFLTHTHSGPATRQQGPRPPGRHIHTHTHTHTHTLSLSLRAGHPSLHSCPDAVSIRYARAQAVGLTHCGARPR
jgi:hypothetical protein